MYEENISAEDAELFGKEYTQKGFDAMMTREYYSGFEPYQPDEKDVYTIDNNEFGKPGI